MKKYGKRIRLTPEEEQTIYDLRNDVATLNYPKDYVKQHTNVPKVFVFDIETSPLLMLGWSLWKQTVGYEHVIKDWTILTWTGKWLFSDKIYSDKRTVDEIENEDDKRVVKSLHEKFDEADVVVAHNAIKFDIKRSNTRFLLNDLDPPSPYQVVDTLKEAKKHFAFTSNRLNDLGIMLDVGGKMETGGIELWKECMNSNFEALKKMEAYNVRDVQLLEDVYVKLRKYMRSHPNLAVIAESGDPCCPACLSVDLEYNGYYNTNVNRFRALKCKSCGTPMRERKTALDKITRQAILSPTAR